MSEKYISPAAMIDLLQSPCTKGSDRADLETLHDFYHARNTDPLVQQIQSSFNQAIDVWDDEQVEDFWVTYLLEPPQSDEFRSTSAHEQRAKLRQIYDYLFNTL